MEGNVFDYELDDNFVVQPYMYEPEPTIEINESDSNDEESEEELDFDFAVENDRNRERIGNVNWCECRNCSAMPTGIESKCCMEFGELSEKLDGFCCITQHPGFVGNCLNRDVIEVSFYEFLQQNGPVGDEEPIHETYRYVAYRRLAQWIWHRLAKYDRRVLPACAVTAIRAYFPSQQYTGYKYARDF